jgi:hypothetical protein
MSPFIVFEYLDKSKLLAILSSVFLLHDISFLSQHGSMWNEILQICPSHPSVILIQSNLFVISKLKTEGLDPIHRLLLRRNHELLDLLVPCFNLTILVTT